MKKKYIVILECGDEEVYFFESIDDILIFFDVDNLDELRNNAYVEYIIEIKEVLYE